MQLASYMYIQKKRKKNVLDKFHFGFRKGHSMTQAIRKIADNLRKAVDHNMYMTRECF